MLPSRRVRYRAEGELGREPRSASTVLATDSLRSATAAKELTAHIPDAHEKTTLFYGWYSNRTRGYRRHHGLLGTTPVVKPAPEATDQAPLEVRRAWARLIRKVYAVAPLGCPHCGSTMKVIAVIEPACADMADRRAAVLRQIPSHLGLPTAAPSLCAPPDPADGSAAELPRGSSYESLFDDLPMPHPVPV